MIPETWVIRPKLSGLQSQNTFITLICQLLWFSLTNGVIGTSGIGGSRLTRCITFTKGEKRLGVFLSSSHFILECFCSLKLPHCKTLQIFQKLELYIVTLCVPLATQN